MTVEAFQVSLFDFLKRLSGQGKTKADIRWTKITKNSYNDQRYDHDRQ